MASGVCHVASGAWHSACGITSSPVRRCLEQRDGDVGAHEQIEGEDRARSEDTVERRPHRVHVNLCAGDSVRHTNHSDHTDRVEQLGMGVR